MPKSRPLPKRPTEKANYVLPTFTENGDPLYHCLTCLDLGWVHPIGEDGKPDRAKVVKCRCQKKDESVS